MKKSMVTFLRQKTRMTILYKNAILNGAIQSVDALTLDAPFPLQEW